MTEKYKISEGAELIIYKTSKFTTNMVSVNFLSPLSKETCSARGLLLNTMKKSCDKYPAAQRVSEKQDELYGASLHMVKRKLGDYFCAGFAMNFIKNEFALEVEDVLTDALDFFCEMLFSPRRQIDADAMETEKNNMLCEIEGKSNDKVKYSSIRCCEIACEGEPFETYAGGDIETLKKITPQKLLDVYAQMLETSPIEVVFVGDADSEKLIEIFKEKLSKIKRNVLPLPKTVTKAAKDIPAEVIETMPVNQGKLALAFKTPITAEDTRYPALALFNNIFGGSPGSKLFLNVRERLSLCYYCSAKSEKNKGLIIVSSGIENDKKEAAETEILAQFEAMKKGEISDREIAEAKEVLKNAFLAKTDSAAEIEDYYLGISVCGGDELDILREKVMAVGKEEIIAAANTVMLDTVYFLKGENA